MSVPIKVKYSYNEEYIPPRCRLPRTRVVEGIASVTIPKVTRKEAPIAMRHRACLFPNTVVYRWWNEALYTRIARRDMVSGGKGWYTLTELRRRMETTPPCCYEWSTLSSEDDALKWAESLVGKYLIVDDELWQKTGEPRYQIATFGLGHNHASTALMIANHYNSNVSESCYFNALDAESAIQEALRVAKARRDTNSLKHIRSAWRIRVYIPEAVRYDPGALNRPGDSFHNMLESLTESAGSQGEAAALVCAATAMEMRR